MASNIPLFVTLDSVNFNVAFETPFRLYYRKGNKLLNEIEEVDLSVTPTGSSYRSYMVKDETKGLRPDDYSLCLEKKITVINCDKMYGPEGLVPEDSELGVALMWTSHDSKSRGSFPMCQVVNQQQEQTWSIACQFPKAMFKGCVNFSIIIYLKKAGETKNPFQCDIEGAVLGEVERYSYLFDGRGSLFPIVTIDDPQNPLLWTIDCSWNDPEEDSFAETVLIKLNKANKNFEKVCFGSPKFDRQLFIEVLSSAMSIIFSTVREKDPEIWKDMLADGYHATPGSVTQVIKYMIDTHDFDLSDPFRSSVSLRSFFDKRLTRK